MCLITLLLILRFWKITFYLTYWCHFVKPQMKLIAYLPIEYYQLEIGNCFSILALIAMNLVKIDQKFEHIPLKFLKKSQSILLNSVPLAL
jgi:hypothetical protein